MNKNDLEKILLKSIINVEYSGEYQENELLADLNKLNINNPEKNIEKLKVINDKGEKILYKYRNLYSIIWSDKKDPELLTYILLNPSTANHYEPDPTLVNCFKIAKNNGYNGFQIVNLYTLRSQKIKYLDAKLESSDWNEDEDNYKIYIENALNKSKGVVLAWGCKIKPYKNRIEDIVALVKANSMKIKKCIKQKDELGFYHLSPSCINNQGINIDDIELLQDVI